MRNPLRRIRNYFRLKWSMGTTSGQEISKRLKAQKKRAPNYFDMDKILGTNQNKSDILRHAAMSSHIMAGMSESLGILRTEDYRNGMLNQAVKTRNALIEVSIDHPEIIEQSKKFRRRDTTRAEREKYIDELIDEFLRVYGFTLKEALKEKTKS